MKDQHKKINGYRDLSQAEIDSMNEIAEIGNNLTQIFDNLECMRDYQISNINDCNLTSEQIKESYRCMDIAKENLQTGLMWLTRGIVLPNKF